VELCIFPALKQIDEALLLRIATRHYHQAPNELRGPLDNARFGDRDEFLAYMRTRRSQLGHFHEEKRIWIGLPQNIQWETK
jgi:hypothetical protein